MIQNRSELGLFFFTVDLEAARQARDAGIDALMVDWEWRGKVQRQAGADTEINRDTPEDLAALTELSPMQRCCRINGFGDWTPREIEQAVASGATDVFLPMVEGPAQVEAFLRLLDGRARPGILVETIRACEQAEDLARLPIELVYLGLNDLALQRAARQTAATRKVRPESSSHLFLPLIDGTAERLRQVFSETAFGLGGLTLVDAGSPVPCLRLLEEMARLGCDYSFLRRSFKRDLVGHDMAREVSRLRSTWRRLQTRDAAEIEAAHGELRQTLEQLYDVDRA